MAWCFSSRASVTTVLSAHPCVSGYLWIYTWRLRQNAWHFADNIFSNAFSSNNFFFSIKISLNLAPKSFIDKVNSGSSNGLAPNTCQDITWTNVDQDLSCHMVSLGTNERNFAGTHIRILRGTLLHIKGLDISNFPTTNQSCGFEQQFTSKSYKSVLKNEKK